MSENDNATQEIDALKNEVSQLRSELEEARRSAYAALRERELLLRSGTQSAKPESTSKLANISHRFENTLRQKNDGIQTELQAAHSSWEAELENKLAAAREEWADEERKRLAKVKVDMSLQRRAAVEERDAYWQAELARHGVGDHADPEPEFPYAMVSPRRESSPTPRSAQGVPNPGILTGLVVTLFIALAAYMFAPEWKPVAKTGLDRVMAQLQED